MGSVRVSCMYLFELVGVVVEFVCLLLDVLDLSDRRMDTCCRRYAWPSVCRTAAIVEAINGRNVSSEASVEDVVLASHR